LAQFQSGTGLTMTGDLVGTLRYMSPEQALAKRAGLDHRTDIYSLGVTLYELLTLEPAFAGTDRAELLRQIAFEEPPPPRRVNAAVPAELETIVLKAMAKDADERYATAQELADDLGRFLKDEPIRARRPTVVQRLRKWARRHRPVVWSAAVALVIVLTVVAASVGWTAHDVAERRTRAEQEARDRAEQDIEALVKEVIWLLDQGKADEALATARRADSRASGSNVSQVRRAQVARLLKDADMVSELEKIRLNEGEHTDAPHGRYAAAFEKYGIPVLALTVEEAATRVKASPIRDRLIVGLDDWTGAVHPEAWRYPAAPGARRNLQVPTAIAQLADADTRRHEMRAAWLKQDWAALERLAKDPALLDQPVATLVLLARMLDARNAEAALDLLRKAQRRHPDDLSVNADLAALLMFPRPHGFDEVIACLRAALARRPQSTSLRLSLGTAQQMKGNVAEAEAEYRAVIDLQPTLVQAHYNLGRLLKRQGELAEAEVQFLTAVQCRGGGAARSDLAETLAMQGKWRRAAVAFARSLDLCPDEVAHGDWYQYAALLLHLGDVQGYRHACREMLRLDGDTEIDFVAEQNAKTCALAPDAVADFQRVVALADLAVKRRGNDRWFLFARGLVAYRAGHFDRAVAWLKRVAPRPQGDSLDAGAFAVLALAHDRLCHGEDARAALAKAQAILAHKTPRPEKGQHFGGNWHDWLRSQILCREAEQRLGQQAAR
jgi:tetratricopeptide (TPR) repeat protein